MQDHLSRYGRNREQRHLDTDELFSVPSVIRPLWRWHPPVQQQYQISGTKNELIIFGRHEIILNIVYRSLISFLT